MKIKPVTVAAISTMTLSLAATCSHAVIVINGTTPSTGRNETAPIGPLAGSGWDLQGSYGAFLGTPIASEWFIRANHVDVSNSVTQLTVGATSHPIIQSVPIAGTDLVLHKTSVPFASWAPLFNAGIDSPLTLTDQLVVFGRGTQRGGAITGGWNWGTGDAVKSWGVNTPNSLSGSSVGTLLVTDFDAGEGDAQSSLSTGDSSGGVFVLRGGQWKLVGINYAVEGFYTTASQASQFTAAIHDARGYYRYLGDFNGNTINDPGDYQLITGASPVPGSAYASYLPSHLTAINAIVPEPTSLALAGLGAIMTLRRRSRC